MLYTPVMGTQHFQTTIAEEGAQRPVILVVDDERGPRESLRMILAGNHEVLTACDGNEALEILKKSKVDLVTMDLNMPGLKGDELVGIIRDEHPQMEIIIITGFGTLETAVSGIRRGVCDFLTKPFDVIQVNAAVERALQSQSSRRRLVGFLEGIGAMVGRDQASGDILNELGANDELQLGLQRLLSEPALAHRAQSSDKLDPNTIEFLELLAETVESNDPGMRGHAQRVSFYVGLLADRLCLGAAAQQYARVAAFLHDIGKVGLPVGILHSDELLTGARREAVEEHPAIAERLLRPLMLPSAILGALRHHHERWDGKGYPDRLKGEEIPFLARIVCVADAFDAMVCESQVQHARSRDEAVDELRRESGKQFDPSLVDVFCSIVDMGTRDVTDLDQKPNTGEEYDLAETNLREKLA